MGNRSRGAATASTPLHKRLSVCGGADVRRVTTQEGHTTEALLARAQQEILVAAYWFDPGDQGEPYSVTISFSGRRADRTGKLARRDSFYQEETVEGILPGSGPVCVTTQVYGINPGEWRITARPVTGRNSRSLPAAPRNLSNGSDAAPVAAVVWPGRTPQTSAGVTSPIKTALAPLARTPGVVRFAWPALVGLGILIGLVLQAILLALKNAQVGAGLFVSLAAVLGGSVGAKLWYIAVHRGRRYDGWCIQGFILGVALVAGTLPLAVLRVSVGTFLDTAAPGLLFGMFIGRPGCFLVGCCAGRPTASRWGLWSSDRRVGMRRIPTQLMEALLCLPIGLAALILLLDSRPEPPGIILVGSLAAYALVSFWCEMRVQPSLSPSLSLRWVEGLGGSCSCHRGTGDGAQVSCEYAPTYPTTEALLPLSRHLPR